MTAVATQGAESNMRAIVDGFQSNIFTQMKETLKTSRHEIETSVGRSIRTLEGSLHSHLDRRLAASSHPKHNLIQTPENDEHGSAPLPQDLIRRGTGRRPPLPTANRLQTQRTNGSPRQCKCHSRSQGSITRWEITWLRYVLAALGISYTGFTFTPSKDFGMEPLCPTCRGHQCSRNRYTWLLIQYHFPTWLTRAILSIYLSHYDRPELLIRINRRVAQGTGPYQENILSIVNANDVRGLKVILSSSPSTVHDISTDHGNPALLFAVFYENVSAVEILLQAGADPLQENMTGSSPARLAFMKSLAMAENPTSPTHHIAAMMPIFDFLEKEDFTDLHRIIIGWLPLDLHAALIRPAFRVQIGKKTAGGLTALHLAARGCPTGNEVQLLLDAGEDPNAVAHASDDATPLSWACLGGNTAGVQALLAAGASPELSCSQGHSKQTLLHDTTYSPRNTIEIFEILLQPQFGQNINTPTILGATVIMAAVANSRLAVLRYLVKNGADMDAVDIHGDTVLNSTVFYRFYDGTRLLLGLDGELGRLEGDEERYRYINTRGWGILHCLAIYGDKETMDIFTGVTMVGLPDPKTLTDQGGKTALDIFNERVGFEVGFGFGPDRNGAVGSPGGGDHDTTELVRAWKDLLGSVNIDVEQLKEGGSTSNTVERGQDGRDCIYAGADEGNSDDEFFDAVEG